MGIPRTARKITNNDTSLSVCKHAEKRVGKHVHHSTRTVESLPRELVIDVLGRVASSSFTDLFNAKLSCKDFLESTTNDYIAQCISIEKFPIIDWRPPNKRALSFLNHCFNKGNPESLFRKGMREYFELANVESGLEYLTRAVEKGHPEATYVYGMILLSSGDQKGLRLLNSINCSRSRCWNVRGSRVKIDSILSDMWINNRPVTIGRVNTICREQDHSIRFEKRGWSLDEDEEIASCNMCLWYRELVYFCKSMNVIV